MKSVVAVLLLLSCGVCEVRPNEHKSHDIRKELRHLKDTIEDLTCLTEGIGCPGKNPPNPTGPCVRDLLVNIDFPGNDFLLM
ncbi:hypothetical protein UPYG_G00331150 [Umbra pygmaea]|uniref:Uncharacterized protein n=1 Tax=Umbra pygmaea TaxID=75934 RepID=A0ABD0VZM3_UMBPY